MRRQTAEARAGIADFCSATEPDSSGHQNAPEVIRQEGCVLYRAATGRLVFPGSLISRLPLPRCARLPEFEPIALGVGRPAEPAIVVALDSVVYPRPGGSELGQYGVEVPDAIVDHERRWTVLIR